MKQIAMIIVFLLAALPAWAAPVNKYVDVTLGTDAAENGGSTGAGAWKSLSYAKSQVGDITAVADGWKINCSNGVDSAGVDFAGPVTDADSPLWINGDATYSLVVANDDAIYIDIDYMTFSDLYIETSAGNAAGQHPIQFSTGIASGNQFTIYNCTLKGHADGTYTQSGILMNDTSIKADIYNCLIYNIAAIAGNSGIYVVAGNPVRIYNTTISGGDYGINALQGTIICKNVLAVGAGTLSFYTDNGGNETVNCINCMADDTSFATTAFDTETSCVDSATNAFTGVFRLAAGDDAIDAGADLSADTPAVTTDIDGTARGATYDIGCDEYVSAATKRRRAIRW